MSSGMPTGADVQAFFAHLPSCSSSDGTTRMARISDLGHTVKKWVQRSAGRRNTWWEQEDVTTLTCSIPGTQEMTAERTAGEDTIEIPWAAHFSRPLVTARGERTALLTREDLSAFCEAYKTFARASQSSVAGVKATQEAIDQMERAVAAL